MERMFLGEITGGVIRASTCLAQRSAQSALSVLSMRLY